MSIKQNELIGYWKVYDAPENTSERPGEIYLRFTENGLLQWGFEDQWKICVLFFEYRLENGKILTVCPPNPRLENTPYSIDSGSKLKIFYGNYQTAWVKTEKQDFFESKNIWGSGILDFRQYDYMGEIELPPTEFQITKTEYWGVSPQIKVNTDALWHAWQYSLGQFASFHVDEFEQILKRGVLVGRTCNQKITLLMYIVSNGYLEVIEPMLEAGFDINAKDMCGNTLLDYAVYNKRDDIFQFLRERGAQLKNELA